MIAEINAYLAVTGLSTNALALMAGTTQSSLQRFLAGERKSVSKSARKTLDFMHKNSNNGIALSANQSADAVLHQTVMKVWDGKPDSALILAQLISTLGPLVQALGQPDRRGTQQ